jgi:riboflavin kinase/FMN adenylyltransferase
LGRHHTLVGTVVEGDKRGRELGYPTANICSDGSVLPPAGVYAAWVTLPDGTRKRAAVNIGVRPTFEAGVPGIEVHILEFDGDLYGEELFVSLVQNIRPEVKFDSPKMLKMQIKRDVIEAKRILTVRSD